MTTADDVHAKLVRALEQAEKQAKGDNSLHEPWMLTILVQPLALASIALELRELRHARNEATRTDALPPHGETLAQIIEERVPGPSTEEGARKLREAIAAGLAYGKQEASRERRARNASPHAKPGQCGAITDSAGERWCTQPYGHAGPCKLA